MKTVQWSVFGVMVLAQLAVPFVMMASREQTMQGGTAYKFRCGPVDPYDYFRGRYVALSFLDTTIADWRGEQFASGDHAFALLGWDEAGYAQIVDVTSTPPISGDYLPVSVVSGGQEHGQLRIALPFDRYFMNEALAPAAEAAYRSQSRTEEGAYVVVRVRDGQGVIEGLYFGELTVEEYLQRETQQHDVQVPER